MGTILANQTNGGTLIQYNSNWSTLRSSSTALIVSNSSAQLKAVNGGGGFLEMDRTYLSFDTSVLSGLTITSLDLKINVNYTTGTTSVIALKSLKTNSENLNTSHFNLFHAYTATNYSNSEVYTPANGWYTISLNSTAISDAVLNGELSLAVIDYTYDFMNVTPSSFNQLTYWYNTGSLALRPYLEYVAPISIAPNGVSTYGKINGVNSGSIGNINGLSLV